MIGETEVRITGIAKGSGMIAPDMATMLCFVFTDAKIPAGAAGAADAGRRHQLQLHDGRFATPRPRDTVLLFATGAGEASRASPAAAAGRMLADFAARA